MWIKRLRKYSLTCLVISNGLFSVSCTKSLNEPFFERPFPCWFHWITRGTFLGMTVSLLISLNHPRNLSWNDRFLADFTESPEEPFLEWPFPCWFHWITRGTFSLGDRFLADFTESPEEPFLQWPFLCWFHWITRGTFLGMTVSLLISLNHPRNLSRNDRFLSDFTESPEEPFSEWPQISPNHQTNQSKTERCPTLLCSIKKQFVYWFCTRALGLFLFQIVTVHYEANM